MRKSTVSSEEGFTLVLVLIAGAMLSILALLFVQYGEWNAQMENTELRKLQLREAIKLGESQARRAIKRDLADTGFVQQPTRMKWSLPPDITLRVRIQSLNARLNLNNLNDPGPTRTFRRVVEEVFEKLGYPRRVVEEIIRWIEPESEISVNAPSRYQGYGYRAPERELRHLDELALISGFRQKGIDPLVRRIFTVHGSGRLNVYHLTPATLELIASAFPGRLPPLPASALRDQEGLREYLSRSEPWQLLKERFPFLTRRDDSFALISVASREGTVLRRKGVYRFNAGNGSLKLLTQYPYYTDREADTVLSRVRGLSSLNGP